MKDPKDAREGEWDFDGACAPAEDGSDTSGWSAQKTFSLGCFQWVRRGKAGQGEGLKKGRICHRICGQVAALAAVYAGARAYCERRNRVQFLVPGAPVDGLWTDYPFVELGDTPHQLAPVRPCTLLSYDGNKYVVAEVAGRRVHLKAGYVTEEEARHGEVAPVRRELLAAVLGVGLAEAPHGLGV